MDVVSEERGDELQDRLAVCSKALREGKHALDRGEVEAAQVMLEKAYLLLEWAIGSQRRAVSAPAADGQ